MSILSTSNVIKNLFDNDVVDDEEIVFNDEYCEKQCQELFNLFSSNKKLNIDFGTVNDFLHSFDVLHKQSYFSLFRPPLVQEYFCKQLNFLLIIDFMLSFFKIKDETFCFKEINTKFIFDFFIKLGDFYNFMNFLDVDQRVIDYLRDMIILYTLQLDRDLIESKFGNIIELIDNFFENEIMPSIFVEIKYKNMDQLDLYVNGFELKYSDELKNYRKDVDYSCEDLKLDDLFNCNWSYDYHPLIEVKNSLQKIHEDDDIEVIYGIPIEYRPVKPKRGNPIIKENDPNYKRYRELFILKMYQKAVTNKNVVLKEIREICKNIGIKKYNALDLLKCDDTIIKIKTILGLNFDVNNINTKLKDKVFELCCEYGNLNLLINVVEPIKDRLNTNDIRKIITSPSRELTKYFMDNKDKYTNIYNKLKNYMDQNVHYEPKIKFNTNYKFKL